MTTIDIDALVRQPMAQAIGWALLQFVWQGALIGVLAAATLAALRRSAADVRYVVATIALSLMLTMPVVTAVQGFNAARLESAPASAMLTAAAEGVGDAVGTALAQERLRPERA